MLDSSRASCCGQSGNAQSGRWWRSLGLLLALASSVLVCIWADAWQRQPAASADDISRGGDDGMPC